MTAVTIHSDFGAQENTAGDQARVGSPLPPIQSLVYPSTKVPLHLEGSH